jgi:hypothetical protein
MKKIKQSKVASLTELDPVAKAQQKRELKSHLNS